MGKIHGGPPKFFRGGNVTDLFNLFRDPGVQKLAPYICIHPSEGI